MIYTLCAHSCKPSVRIMTANLTSVMFNDNGIFEYILQDDIYMGVLGMLECGSCNVQADPR